MKKYTIELTKDELEVLYFLAFKENKKIREVCNHEAHQHLDSASKKLENKYFEK